MMTKTTINPMNIRVFRLLPRPSLLVIVRAREGNIEKTATPVQIIIVVANLKKVWFLSLLRNLTVPLIKKIIATTHKMIFIGESIGFIT